MRSYFSTTLYMIPYHRKIQADKNFLSEMLESKKKKKQTKNVKNRVKPYEERTKTYTVYIHFYLHVAAIFSQRNVSKL